MRAIKSVHPRSMITLIMCVAALFVCDETSLILVSSFDSASLASRGGRPGRKTNPIIDGQRARLAAWIEPKGPFFPPRSLCPLLSRRRGQRDASQPDRCLQPTQTVHPTRGIHGWLNKRFFLSLPLSCVYLLQQCNTNIILFVCFMDAICYFVNRLASHGAPCVICRNIDTSLPDPIVLIATMESSVSCFIH